MYYGTRGSASLDAWKVMVDVSSLGWDMQYEGPARPMTFGEPLHAMWVWLPNILAVIIMVDDKAGRRAVSGTQPEPRKVHVIAWQPEGHTLRRGATYGSIDQPLYLWRYALRVGERESSAVVYRSAYGYEATVDGNRPDRSGYVAYRSAGTALQAAREYVLTALPGAREENIEVTPGGRSETAN